MIITEDQKINLELENEEQVCFVKLYLFEKEILPPLNDYLQKVKQMRTQVINTKCEGLEVIAPVHCKSMK